ncbi:uncharacterized protein LOC120355721, partial [Nilaparvata lugens]|uniref:uncharacterized protein LOC120355721 n=1 Tax=Nilaparvata lugens TaxID=108931 RepID=UPI00193D7947
MSVVGGVFIVFALMALCYRSVVVHKNFSLCLRRKSQSSLPKYDPPYVKPMAKKYSKSSNPEEEAMECADKIRSFGNMTPFNEQQRLFRSSGAMNHSVRGMPSSYEEHKMHKMQRLGLGSGSEEEPMHS